MIYEIRRASGFDVNAGDVPGIRLETKGIADDCLHYFVEVPPGYALERICEATHHKLILNPFDKTLTIYDDYVE